MATDDSEVIVYNEPKVGTALKKIREAKNITQTQLATQLGIDRSGISKYEHDLKGLKLYSLYKHAQALECDVFVIINDKINNTTKTIKLEE